MIGNFSRPRGEAVVTTTVIGAYPKITDDPPGQGLRRALHRFDRGEIDEQTLNEAFDAQTARAVGELEAAGIDVPNHGEIRWGDPFGAFVRAWRNVTPGALERVFDNNTYFRVPAVRGAIEVVGPATVVEYRVARASARRRVKGAVCGPLTFARVAEDHHYGDRRRLALGATAALREEIAALEAAGCDLVDVEEPGLVRWPEDVALAREVYAELARGRRAQLALQLFYFPADPVIDHLAELPFAQIGIDLKSRPTKALDRVGALPRTVVLGVVDARNTRLESPEEVARDFERAARAVGPDRVWLAPTASLEFLPHGVARDKLRVLAAGAALALTAGGAR